MLCGRSTGVALDETGIAQMCDLAKIFIDEPIDTIQSSPQLRARQSADIVARCLSLGVEIVEAADEMEFGDWTAQSFADLEANDDWRRWNAARGSTRPPRGESMQEASMRLLRHLEELSRDLGEGTAIMVSHAEPIRAVLLMLLGIPFDRFLEIEVAPGSVATIKRECGRLVAVTANMRAPA